MKPRSPQPKFFTTGTTDNPRMQSTYRHRAALPVYWPLPARLTPRDATPDPSMAPGGRLVRKRHRQAKRCPWHGEPRQGGEGEPQAGGKRGKAPPDSNVPAKTGLLPLGAGTASPVRSRHRYSAERRDGDRAMVTLKSCQETMLNEEDDASAVAFFDQLSTVDLMKTGPEMLQEFEQAAWDIAGAGVDEELWTPLRARVVDLVEQGELSVAVTQGTATSARPAIRWHPADPAVVLTRAFALAHRRLALAFQYSMPASAEVVGT